MFARSLAARSRALVAASVVASDIDEVRKQAARALEQGAQAIELRADFLEDPTDENLCTAACVAARETAESLPVIFTLRTHEQGGAARIDACVYERIVEAIVASRALDVVDIEFALPDDVRQRLMRHAHELGVETIVSHHDISHTPSVEEIVQKLEAMQRCGADVVKVAYMAQQRADAQRVLAGATLFSVRADAVPLCAIAMGEAGALTRVLGQAVGSRLTYAVIDTPAAPGQMTVSQAVKCAAKVEEFTHHGHYRELVATNLFDEHAQVVALLGSPIGHSLSPALHNQAFAASGISAYYVALECAEHQIVSAMEALRANPAWVGCNVTMPCKHEVIRFLDGLDDGAALAGAVNTIAKRGTRLVGYNTDGIGFVASLREHGIDVEGARICVIGGGGAARAIGAQCALDKAASVCFAIRPGTSRRAAVDGLVRAIASDTSCQACVVDYTDGVALARTIAQSTILVNATPCGMGIDSASSPVDVRLLHPGLVVADAVYDPVCTQLLTDAERTGCTCVTGLGMLEHQAKAAERIWFS